MSETPLWPVERCGSCAAAIVRAIHERTLRPTVIDAEPSADGNIELVAAQSAVIYRILPADRLAGRTNLRTSHFSSCAQADSWRKKRGQQ